ncbi:sensor histidine kinase [Paenibacillus psychroresistens]|uniref:Sensor histidine kinase n=1 Tax=Paenibacillus psychroresistens TaxID=1778678 RepID=A0A6B8RSX1_9BACL|nr:sensor histidine kinase [Paenibacillus psychroresistens]QGQ98675.1 sensor histidine kinase [Paenibacillus psychroresistens]
MLKALLLGTFRNSMGFLEQRIQWFKNLPVVTKLVVINFILIALPLAIASYLTYTSYSTSIQKNIGRYQMDVVKELTANIDTYMNELNLLSLMPYQAPEIIQYLAAPKKPDEPLPFTERVNLEDFTKRVFANGRVDITGITLYSSVGGAYEVLSEAQPNYSYKSVKDELWFAKVSQTGKVVYVKSKNENNYSFARKIRSVETGNELGYVVLDVDKNIIRNKMEALTNENKNIIILDETGDLVYKSQAFEIEPNAINQYSGSGTVVFRQQHDKVLLSYYTSPITGWKMMEMVPLATLLADTVQVRNYIILIGLICLLLGVIISIWIAVRITNPISELRNLMKKVVRGDLDVSIPISSRDEIGQLSQSFNTMVSKLSDLGYRLFESEIREKNSQIAALQSQINPHFLYNTLGSISMYAEIQGNREVVKMTNSLSKLLRYSINSQKSQVPLEMELEHVKGYMAIQQIRFEHKIQFYVEVEPELLKGSVIRFILQPIVENSIVHGFEKGNGFGTIILSGKKIDDTMVIKIQDDGAGMNALQLQALLDKKTSIVNPEEGKGGHGLMNVHRRIVLRYGNQFGLTIESDLAKGTTISLVLPFTDVEVMEEN